MNNRIQELTEQAGIMYGTAVDYYYTRATDGVTSDQMAKFAELIIEKCGELADNYVEHGIPSSAIDKYFGVER